MGIRNRMFEAYEVCFASSLQASWRGYQLGDKLRIDKMDFGFIIVNGKKHENDVVVTNESVEEKERSHKITKEDAENILLQEPEIIIIGTGTTGLVKVTKEAMNLFKEQQIELLIDKTQDAVVKFNKIKDKKKIGVFHITC